MNVIASLLWRIPALRRLVQRVLDAGLPEAARIDSEEAYEASLKEG